MFIKFNIYNVIDMKSTKAKELKIVYDRLIKVSLVDMSAPLSWINQCYADTITGFGSAKDEKINSLEELRQLIKNGRKQSRIFTSFHLKKLTPYKPTYTSDDVAVFSDEFLLSTKLGNESFQLHLFFTCVFQNFGKSWKCISFHGSVPPDGSTTEDTFHMDESKKRIIELEDKVAERTFQLSQKNQELQLEASLEKVRTASWMMKGTDELVNLVAVLFSELGKLGFDLDGGAIVLNIFDHQTDDITQWIIDANHQFPYSFKHPHFDNPILNDIRNAKKNGVRYFSNTYSRSVKNAFWNFYFSNTDFQRFPKKLQKEILSKPSYAQSMALGKNTAILHPNINGSVLDKDQQYILQRFANVFEQSYSRFLDLQKAEAQAREAQLEAALERVRIKTIGMHSSQDVGQAVLTMFNELAGIGNKSLRSGILIINENITMDVWTAHQDGSIVIGNVDMQIHKLLKEVFDSWKRGEQYFEYKIGGKEQSAYFKAINESSDYPIKYDIKSLPKSQFCHCFFFSEGAIFAWGESEISGNLKIVFQRFADVFRQTYKRYIDLQKAEAQAREALIELALERVRAKTMAMHNSEDVGSAIATLFTELGSQGIENFRCGIAIINIEKMMEVWSVTNVEEGKLVKAAGKLNMNDHELWQLIFDKWENKQDFLYYHLSGNEKQAYIEILNSATDYLSQPILEMPDLHCQIYFFSEGAIWAYSLQPHNAQEQLVMKRFTSVFSQTYLRYRDLQKAEAQARESQVEAALERVRSRSMAMNKSEEFPEVIQVVLDQFVQLDFKIDAAQFDVEFRETDDLNLWSATPEHPYPTKLHVPYADNEVFNSLKKAKEDGRDFAHVQLTKQQKNTFFKYFFLHVPNITDDRKKLILSSPGMARSVILLDKVSLGIQNYSGIPYSDEEHAIVKRFAKAFEQTYTRFLDLQKAEASAIQSKKQAAIDRIRAEVAAMRTKQDLDFIIPIIWRELSRLSIPFTRCGIFIMDDDKRQISVFLSTPDGKSLAAFELDYNTELFSNALQSWQKKEIFVAEWGRDEFSSLATMIGTDDSTQHQYYSSSIPTDQLSLHFVPFLQGILYVGNSSMLSESQLEQIQSIATALSAAYARYDDFRRLEAAKLQVEKTLIDLQVTQKQLVQSEKMASLGELTAGIAHEIQNPLNFVNNFSEVSTELVKEMKSEIKKGNYDEVNVIADDVKQNLEKINHHGQRAADIVKGMLQHSRSSSGVKEPTDINALADEYFRLAYHGLRAKDKTFNATMKTDFDESIGKIDIIPQDIARVVLNLITNAFYAVNEKSKQGIADYEPTVSVVTKKVNHQVEIRVTDNGNGIPANIVDKIFQPFFTTKPTGQGTGLGLSLSYDILKAHRGELKVETAEGEGSTFNIELPTA
jgi:signal transduction histidine kinase